MIKGIEGHGYRDELVVHYREHGLQHELIDSLAKAYD